MPSALRQGSESASAWAVRVCPTRGTRAFARSCELAPGFFQEPIATKIKNDIAPTEYSFKFAVCTVIDPILGAKYSGATPRSIEHFLHCVGEIFLPSVTEPLAARLRGFDAKAGVTGFADASIQEMPIGAWIRNLVLQVASQCEAEAERQVGSDPTVAPTPVSNPETTSSPQGPGLQGPALPPSSPPDEIGGPSVAVSTAPLPEEERPCRIIQLYLEGATLLEAWKNEPVTRDMELQARPRADWTPGDHSFDNPYRAMAVYHGTELSALEQTWGPLPPETVAKIAVCRGFLGGGSSLSNQVAPSRNLAVAWTAFSPLRCFLWAAFKADVYDNIPDPTASHRLARNWKCGFNTHNHTGVVFLRYTPPLPCASGQAFYQLPPGREAMWDQVANGMRWSSTPQEAWAQFASAFPDTRSLETWPPVLHCREYGPQATNVLSFTKQLWRTVWHDAGIATLNEYQTHSYAISFHQVPADIPSESGKDVSHSKGKDSD